MLQCPKETFARLFYNVSSSSFLLLFFFHFTSIFLAKLFIFFGGNPFYQRNQEGYEFNVFSDEEVEGEDMEEEESNEMYGAKCVDEKSHLGAADVFNVGSYDATFIRGAYEPLSEEDVEEEEQEEEEEEEEEDEDEDEDEEEESSLGENSFSSQATSYSTPVALDEDEVVLEEILEDSSSDSETNVIDPTSGFVTGVTTSHIEANNNNVTTRGGCSIILCLDDYNLENFDSINCSTN